VFSAGKEPKDMDGEKDYKKFVFFRGQFQSVARNKNFHGLVSWSCSNVMNGELILSLFIFRRGLTT
jgi:hypothetical protein